MKREALNTTRERSRIFCMCVKPFVVRVFSVYFLSSQTTKRVVPVIASLSFLLPRRFRPLFYARVAKLVRDAPV